MTAPAPDKALWRALDADPTPLTEDDVAALLARCEQAAEEGQTHVMIHTLDLARLVLAYKEQ